MLDQAELVKSLGALGIDQKSYRVLSLLPLVSVAWSDGKVQRAERQKILEVASAGDMLQGGGRDLLESWLDKEPSSEVYERGFKVLLELARRKRGLGSEINVATLDELIELSVDIASAAGGLFGKVWAISQVERAAIEKVAFALSIDDGSSWAELLEELGDEEEEG